MSSYAEFYIKSKKGEYLPLGEYGRSTSVYQIVKDFLSYEKSTPLSASDIKNFIEETNNMISSINQTIIDYTNEKEWIAKTNNSLEEKVEEFYRIDNELRETKEFIEEVEETLIFFKMLMILIDEAEFTKCYTNEKYRLNSNDYIYAGIDCGRPNDCEGDE